MDESWQRSRNWLRVQKLLPIAAGIAALPLLWVFVRAFLANDRGLDLTDEGLYLLEADPPTRTAAWGFPYGWMTGPLFRAVRYDIADFRTLGGVILMLATGVLAAEALRLGSDEARSTDPSLHAPSFTLRRAVSAAVIAAVSFSALLFYSELGLLRVPSYNWLNLVGIIVALTGILRLVRTGKTSRFSDGRALTELLPGTAIVAFGTFLSAHAKPTTPLLLALAAYPALRRALGGPRVWSAYILIILTGSLFTLVAIISPIWPSGFLGTLTRPLMLPPLSSGHDPVTALGLMMLAPLELFRRALVLQPHWLVGPTLLLLSAEVASRIRGRWQTVLPTGPSRRRVVTGFAACIAIFGAMLVGFPSFAVETIHMGAMGPISDLLMPGRLDWPVDGYLATMPALVRIGGWLLFVPAASILGGWMGPTRRHRPLGMLLGALGVTSLGLLSPAGLDGAGFVIGVAELSAAWLLFSRSIHPDRKLSHVAEQVPVTALILSSMLIYAFGHDTGAANAIPAAAALGAIGGMLIVAGSHPRLMSLVVFSALIATATVVRNTEALERPYRSSAIEEQTQSVRVGAHGAALLMDEEIARYLAELRAAADEQGWKPGDRLYGLHVTWSSGIPYILGATVPPTLMPGLQFHEGGLARFERDLEEQDLEDWSEAWLMLPTEDLGSKDGIARRELEAAEQALSLYLSRVGRRWPEDYRLVWSAPGDAPRSPHTRITLWKPA